MEFVENLGSSQDGAEMEILSVMGSPSGGPSIMDPHFGLGEFLTSDSASSAPSISSASPPRDLDWGSSWADQPLDLDSTGSMNPLLFSSAMSSFDQPQHHQHSMNYSELSIGMFNNTPEFNFMLNPELLHKVHAPTLAPQAPQQTISPTEDIISAIKRSTGITNAQIAGAPSVFAPNLQEALTPPNTYLDQQYTPTSDTSSLPSRPGPTTPVDTEASIPVGPSGRPKTAHTTIERRYRTNLNTCIVGLRNAIPAVRFLDKEYKPANGEPDVVDSNGYVDGVKAARKISKATIMSKAREYIVVLKRREGKVQRELEGLKELMLSLVGGPILLQEWERQWAARQSEEADEDMENGDMESDEDEDDGSADERPKKRVKVATAPAPKTKRPARSGSTASPTTEEGKNPRKRGRPSKQSTSSRQSPVSSSPTHAQYNMLGQNQVTPKHEEMNYSLMSDYSQPPQPRPAYLLASFVFLSLFKPSRTIIEDSEPHLGAVLSSNTLPIPTSWMSNLDYHTFLSGLHTMLLIVLFAALVISVLPDSIRNWLIGDRWNGQSTSKAQETEKIESVAKGLAPENRVEDFIQARRVVKGASETGLQLAISARLENCLKFEPTGEELGLLALLKHASKPSQALELWKQASASTTATGLTKLALTLSLPRAVEVLHQSRGDVRLPFIILASSVVEERIALALRGAFVEEVKSICGEPVEAKEGRSELFSLAREVGGKPLELMQEWDLALTGRFARSVPLNDQEDESVLIIHALSLMRRIFPCHSRDTCPPLGLPSPPPSPLLQEEQSRMERSLRASLDSPIFYKFSSDKGEDLQRARDSVISRLSQAARLRRTMTLDSSE